MSRQDVERYLDAKYSRWLSCDPVLGEYIPAAGKGTANEAGKLPGVGGAFNSVNLNLYHYAGNNPVRYVDPDGKTEVYFLYVYTNSERDQSMKADERNSINEEVELLKKSGVSVEIIENATKQDVLNAFNDPEVRMIVTSGHGADDAKIQTHEGGSDGYFTPSDVPKDKEKMKNLKFVIFENCHQGSHKGKWQKTMKNTKIIGWKGTTTTTETISFNNNGKNDRQFYNLEDYAKKVINEHNKDAKKQEEK